MNMMIISGKYHLAIWEDKKDRRNQIDIIMTWIEEHFAREYPEIKTIQDIWNKDDLGGYQTQRYSKKLNKVIITNDLTAISNDLKSIGLTLADFKQQLTLF